MPLAGVAAPVTLIGAVTQHATECLAGIVIHQLAFAGSPIVWEEHHLSLICVSAVRLLVPSKQL